LDARPLTSSSKTLSLIDKVPAAHFIKDLVIESHPVEHRLHL
jgi:hypothetical protein